MAETLIQLQARARVMVDAVADGVAVFDPSEAIDLLQAFADADIPDPRGGES